MTNRDLTYEERDALESLIDSTSVVAVMQALSEICGEKAEHIRTNWQDAKLAREWDHTCGVIGCASTTINGRL